MISSSKKDYIVEYLPAFIRMVRVSSFNAYPMIEAIVLPAILVFPMATRRQWKRSDGEYAFVCGVPRERVLARFLKGGFP